jgi:glycosyltransferase involved in cell wall biosynthesis
MAGSQGMRISCIIVSFNNGDLLERAILSVLAQTRPVDEIVVADDGSTDGSRSLVEALANAHSSIRPIFREKNLGVSKNRDLAMREADADLVTWLDGDDLFSEKKIEAEAGAIGDRSDRIAYSDIRFVNRATGAFEVASFKDFSRMGASDRLRLLLRRTGWSPAFMLLPKKVHMEVGGYNHGLRTYEDWDYMLRLAVEPLEWVYSGTEGPVLHIGPGGGLSDQASIDHLRDELRVLNLNRRILRRHVGSARLLGTAGRAIAFRTKWFVVNWYWRRRDLKADDLQR